MFGNNVINDILGLKLLYETLLYLEKRRGRERLRISIVKVHIFLGDFFIQRIYRLDMERL